MVVNILVNLIKVLINIYLIFIMDLKFIFFFIKGVLNLKFWVLGAFLLDFCNFCNVVDIKGFIVEDYEYRFVFFLKEL